MPPSRRPELAPREFVFLMASCMAMVALSIDLMLPAFSDMREEFGLDPDSTATSWVITAFFLGLAAGQLVHGPLSDRVGRKAPLYAGLVIMSIGAAGAALAPSLATVIVFRIVWGIGAAGPRSLALAIVRDVFGGERMARTMSLIMTTFILVPVVAPSVGAGIMAVAPWRALFWIPAVAAALVALWARRLPESLAPERRRATSPAALVAAAREVVRTPEAVGFGLALTFVYGVMTGWVGSSELIVDEVFHQGDRFPLVFGALALFMAGGSFLNARVVSRIGLHRLLRIAAATLLAAGVLMTVLAVATDGEPPLVAFGACMAAMLCGTAVMLPNCNTAAMLPLPHVAGMAAALLGTVSTAGGALLGSLQDSRFDGTVLPFAEGVLVYVALGFAAVFLIGSRATAPATTADPVCAPVAGD